MTSSYRDRTRREMRLNVKPGVDRRRLEAGPDWKRSKAPAHGNRSKADTAEAPRRPPAADDGLPHDHRRSYDDRLDDRLSHRTGLRDDDHGPPIGSTAMMSPAPLCVGRCRQQHERDQQCTCAQQIVGVHTVCLSNPSASESNAYGRR